MYCLGASMQLWLHLNQKLFGLKCLFKCVIQFGCDHLDDDDYYYYYFFFFNLMFHFFHCGHGHLNN